MTEEKLQLIKDHFNGKQKAPKLNLKDFEEERPYLGGAGFGLSTTKTLIELMGGEIDFKSLPWFRTEARFTIPLKKEPNSVLPDDPPSPDKSLLVV